jgi:hypothetical protein
MAARVKYIIALLALHTQPYTETAKNIFLRMLNVISWGATACPISPFVRFTALKKLSTK